MKSYFLLVLVFISFFSTVSLANIIGITPTDLSVTPALPAAGSPFTLTVSGEATGCFDGVMTSSISGNDIYLDLLASPLPPGSACIAMYPFPWSYDEVIAGQDKGLYSVYFRYNFSNIIISSYELMGYVPVNLPDIQSCTVSSSGSDLVHSGGIVGDPVSYSVEGSYSLVNDGDENNSWLTDINLYAPTGDGDVIDIAKLLGLPQTPVYLENGVYTGTTYYDGSSAPVSFTITKDSSTDTVSLTGSVVPGCCDRLRYDLNFSANILKHSTCLKFPVADLNKDCIVNFQDMAIIASEWMSCEMLIEDDCNN